MDNLNIEECVSKNTIKFGIGEMGNISSLTIKKQLIQIEEFLQEFCLLQKELMDKVKQFSKLSILSVSTGAKVPRSQVNLNTNTLKYYIENRIMEIEKMDILNVKKYEKIKSEKRELEIHLDGLRNNIVDAFELRLRIERLEAENKRLIGQMELRQKHIQKIEEENRKVLKALNDQNNKKIIHLNNISN